MSGKKGILLVGLVALAGAAALIWSRLGNELTDEQILLVQIDAAAAAAEKRDAKQLRQWLSKDYHDGAGRGVKEINQLLSFYFLRRGWMAVYIVGKKVQLDPGPSPRAASAVVQAVLTRGKRLERLQDVVPEAARSLVFTLRFRKEADDTWRLTSADWRRGDDLHELLTGP